MNNNFDALYTLDPREVYDAPMEDLWEDLMEWAEAHPEEWEWEN